MRFTSGTTLLLAIQTLFFFGGAVSGVFQNLYLYQLGSYHSLVLYSVVQLTMLLLIYLVSGKMLKRFSSRTLIRLGMVAFVVLQTSFFVLKERAIAYIIPLGIISGLGHGLFWSGNNLTAYVLTRESTRYRYFGILNFFLNIALMIGPVVGGRIIALADSLGMRLIGYTWLFLIVAGIDTLIAIFAGFLPRLSGVEFLFRHIFQHRREKPWRIVLFQQFLYGLWDVAFAAFSSIIIFNIVKKEFHVGLVSGTTSFVFAVGSLLAGRLLPKKPFIAVTAGIIAAVGIAALGWRQNMVGLILFLFLTNLALPSLNVATSKAIYDVMDRSHQTWQYKYHFLIERDFALGIGRVFNFVVLLLIFTPINQRQIAETWVRTIPILPIIIGLLQWQLLRIHSIKKMKC